MKKLIKLLTLSSALVLATLTSNAQQFQARSFIAQGIRTLIITNGVISGDTAMAFTNLNSIGAKSTNSAGIQWTNGSGTWVQVTNGVPGTGVSGVSFVTNDSTALVTDVSLWGDRNGTILAPQPTNNFVGNQQFSGVQLSITVNGGAGFTGANLNFTFVGVPDGTNEVTTGTVASGIPSFTVGVPGQGAAITTVVTNIPMYNFGGMSKLRLQKIANAVTTAANVQANVRAVNLCGFVP